LLERVREYTLPPGQIDAWRLERFMAEGASLSEAEELVRAEIDWHAYASLRAQGASARDAYRILR
jgi:hypothetical protein